MKISLNFTYSKIMPFLDKKKNTKINFKSGLKTDTFEKSVSSINKVYEYLSASNSIVRYVNQDITAGETLANRDDKFFNQLSNWGVKTIIDLREFDEKYQKKCKNNGIEYVSIPLTHILNDKKDGIFDYKNNGKVKDSFVDQVETLLKHTKQGNVYLGCQYGVDRTNFALVLDYILNYDSNHCPPKIFPSNYASRNVIKNKNINLVKKIIKRLSSEQRQKLNLPDDFEDVILFKRIGEIIKKFNTGLSNKEYELIENKTNFSIMN